eukprot:COSAG01_NODE_2303_length_7952_cov_4.127849_1_plen_25_part_10
MRRDGGDAVSRLSVAYMAWPAQQEA